MTDLSKTTEPKSDQLSADDLIGGKTLTITVTKVSGNDDPAQPISIYFKGDNGKPFRPCKSMRRVLIDVWGKDGAKYVGRQMTLFRDPTVKYAGIEVGGLRISHMSDLDKRKGIPLTVTRGSKKMYVVEPLKEAAVQAQEVPVEAPVEQPSKLYVDGERAAQRGVEAYKEWLAGLDDDQKAEIKPHHSKLSKIAKAANPVSADQ